MTQFSSLKNRPWLPPLLLFLLIQVAYANALPNQFLWDDEILILSNPLIRSWDYATTIFSTGLFEGTGNYFRPLAIFTYLLDHTFFGLDSFGFHLTQNFWHAFVALGFYFLLRRHFSSWIAFAAALVYALHPAHAAQILALSGRCGILEGWWVWALLFVSMSVERPRYRILGFLAYALALLSKESALLFPFLVAAYGALFFSGSQRRRLFISAMGFVLLAVFYFVAHAIWAPVISNPLSMIAKQSLAVRLWTGFACIVQYFYILFFPLYLRTERHFVEGTVLSILPWLGLVTLLALTAIAWRSRRLSPHLTFGLFWFGLFLAPTLNVLPQPVTMAEHWLYLPMMGACWIFAWALSWTKLRSKFLVMSLGVLLLLFAARIVVRSFDYRDGFTLYRTDVVSSPNSFLLHTNLGVEWFRNEKMDEAKRELQLALELMPSYGVAANNLGVIYGREGDMGSAERMYKFAIEQSNYSLAYTNLAKLYFQQGKRDEAEAWLVKGIALYPLDGNMQEMLSALRK